MGMPTKCTEKSVMLNLARRKAPAITKIRTGIYPQKPKILRLTFHAVTAGATPKDIKSDKESSSFPKLLGTFNFLAIFPSILSTNAAIMMRIAAVFIFDDNIANTPKDKFRKVIVCTVKNLITEGMCLFLLY